MNSSTNLVFTGMLASIMGMALSCKKPYDSPVINSAASYLVVEGVISDTTLIKLSNTVNLTSAAAFKPVLGAKVMVQSNTSASVPLIETGNGFYQAAVHLNVANTYQLKIVTADNTAYASDLVAVKNAPAIDTLNYVLNGGNVQVNLNTHDVTGNSRYYRWTYNETYIIHPPFDSGFELQQDPKDTVVLRPASQQIYTCWVTDSSSNITLGSSAKLAQDVISQQQITALPVVAEKLTDLYSILVTQYVLTPDAFSYWQLLQKNTEQLGSIFDAQPSQLTGNIHCTSNPAIVAIGYITAGSVTQKRFFIDARSLPAILHDSPYEGCKLNTWLFKYSPPSSSQVIDQVAAEIYPGYQVPVGIITPHPGSSVILGYTGSTAACVDCTLRGTKIQPAFWPN